MDSEPASLPVEQVTPDQVVAFNIRYWRKAAGLTQAGLGQKLGWSDANVSAAERSVSEGRDRRRFDAQTLIELAVALGVPVAALLLPPDDDGERARYVFTACGEQHDMGDLMELAVMPDSPSDAPVMEAYRRRLRVTVGRYLDEGWETEVGSWLRDIEPAELRAERAERLRAFADSRIAEAAELLSMAHAIDPDPEKTRPLDPERGKP